MGLDIGFNLYEKKPFDEKGELVNVENIDTPYVSGRTDVTYSWGKHFKFNHESTETPVFQKGLDGKEDKLEEFSIKYRFLPFEDFKQTVTDAINETIEDCGKEKIDLLKQIKFYTQEIKELRDLQKDCSENQKYAFDRWEEDIRDYKKCVEDITDSYKTFDEEDYNYTHALWVKSLLEEMEKYLNEDKYYIIPYFSY